MAFTLSQPRCLNPNRIAVLLPGEVLDEHLLKQGYLDMATVLKLTNTLVDPFNTAKKHLLRIARFIGDDGKQLPGPREDLTARRAQELLWQYQPANLTAPLHLYRMAQKVPVSSDLEPYRTENIAALVDEYSDSMVISEMQRLVAEDIRVHLSCANLQDIPNPGPLEVDPRVHSEPHLRTCSNKPSAMFAKLAEAMGTDYRRLFVDCGRFIYERYDGYAKKKIQPS